MPIEQKHSFQEKRPPPLHGIHQLKMPPLSCSQLGDARGLIAKMASFQPQEPPNSPPFAPGTAIPLTDQVLQEMLPPASSRTTSGSTSNYFRVSCLDSFEYTLQNWKNGLGKTEEIFIDPPNSDFRNDPFRWRLSRASISFPCSFSHFPTCTNTIVVLPLTSTEALAKKADDFSVKMFHNGSPNPHVLRPLMPYTYSGAWQTNCELSAPCQDITVMVNSNKAHAEVTVETVDQDQSFRNLVFVSTCALYIVDGYVRVSIDSRSVVVGKGQTIIIEKGEDAAPRWLLVQSVCEADSEAATKTSSCILLPKDSKDAVEDIGSLPASPIFKVSSSQDETSQSTFLFIQIKNLPAQAELPLMRKGSVILNDEVAPKPSKYQLNEPAFAYSPPPWSLRPVPEFDVPNPTIVDKLDWERVPKGTITSCWVQMLKQGLSDWIRVPCIIARGGGVGKTNVERDPSLEHHATSKSTEIVFGMTAALHGNEVNGVNCLQRLIADLDISKLRGTIIVVLCLNIPGYLNFKREFSDGKDLNRQFPGKKDGVASQIYAHLIMDKIVQHFDYLIDLHTASFGRVNSYYVRADMNDPVAAAMARFQQPQIILHNSGQDGTLRSSAVQRGIKSITVEIGNPQQFQSQYIQWAVRGLRNILHHLGMYDLSIPPTPNIQRSMDDLLDTTQSMEVQPHPAVLCSKGFWMYTQTGGVLEVYPSVNTFVRKGMIIARILNIFGNTVEEYEAPCDAMVIGKSTNPVAMAGDRIIHLGVLVRQGDTLPAVAKENY